MAVGGWANPASIRPYLVQTVEQAAAFQAKRDIYRRRQSGRDMGVLARPGGPLALWHSGQSAGSRSNNVPFVQRTFSGSNAAKLEGLRWVS